MRTLYARWMYDWEDRLCSVSTNRVVRPFDWGLEWTRQLPLAPAPADQDPYTYLNSFNDAALAAPNVAAAMAGKPARKVIVVPNRIVNIVV